MLVPSLNFLENGNLVSFLTMSLDLLLILSTYLTYLESLFYSF